MIAEIERMNALQQYESNKFTELINTTTCILTCSLHTIDRYTQYHHQTINTNTNMIGVRKLVRKFNMMLSNYYLALALWIVW